MKFRAAVSLLVLPLLFAACDDSAGPSSGDRLTRAEALLIAGEVSGSVSTTSALPAGNAVDGVASVPITFSREHESSHPCPRGGTVQLSWRVDGSLDVETGSFELDVDGTHKASGCAYLHEGVTLTITGNPDLDFGAHVAVRNGQPSEPFTANVDGAFSWTASDGRSGTCTIEYEEVTDFAARKRTVEGNICGHSVNETFVWNN
jgi:hypothetical protein